MSENKPFKIALLVSALIHSIFFISYPGIRLLAPKYTPRDLKITYCKVKEVPEKKLIGIKPTEKKIPLKGIKPTQPEKMPEVKKEDILKKSEPVEAKKEIPKPKVKPVSKVEVVKEVKFEEVIEEEKDDAKKATYISYYRSVRERISYFATINYPSYNLIHDGEVFLTFVVASNGELLRVSVVDERSTDNQYLRKIALDSIRDASPFPIFPEGLNQYQITFNVIISFEEN
ncbi:MAG: TonB family protein [Candidatus Omnitrophota bacterium]